MATKRAQRSAEMWATQYNHLWASAVLGALAVAAFLNSLSNGFVLDDRLLIVHNPLVRTPVDVRAIFTSSYWPPEFWDGMYRPLLVLSFALNYAASGLRPFSYHLINVLLHAANSALVYGLTWQLFRQRGLAFLAGAAFALHPVHTEAVANVIGRGELLAAALVFLSWLLYLRRDAGLTPGTTDGQAPWHRPALVAGSVLCFALALLTKEHAIALPGLLVLSDALRESQRQATPSWRALGRALWRRLTTVYPAYLAVAAAYLLVRTMVVGQVMMRDVNWVMNPLAVADPASRLRTAMRLLSRYVWLLLAPVRLSADYSYNQVPLATSLLQPDVLVPLLSLGIIAWALRRRAPAVTFGIGAFLVAILPVVNLLFPIGVIMAERLLYLPSFGFCVALAAMVVLASEWLARRRNLRWTGYLPIGAFALLLVLYGGKTLARNPVWATEMDLWRATVVSSPNSVMAHFRLGSRLEEIGDLDGARREMEAAIRIIPASGDAQRALASIRVMQVQGGAAIAAHHASIQRDPDNPRLRYALARTYEEMGFLPETKRALEWVAELALYQDQPASYLAMGEFLLRHGQPAAAERWLRLGVRTWPNNVDVHLALGTLYWTQGQAGEAKAAFDRALQIDPNSAAGHRGLDLVLKARGEAAGAAQGAQRDGAR